MRRTRKCRKCKEHKNTVDNYKIYRSGLYATICNGCNNNVREILIECQSCGIEQPKKEFTLMPGGRVYKKCKSCKAARMQERLEKRDKIRGDNSLIDRRPLGSEAKAKDHRTAQQLKAENDAKESKLNIGYYTTVDRFGIKTIRQYVKERPGSS